MSDIIDAKICANEVCNCLVEDETDYCSPACDAAVEGDIMEITCDCGHPGCSMEMEVSATA